MTIIDALAKTATTTKKYVDTTFGTKQETMEANTKAETAISMAAGANQAKVFEDYREMASAIKDGDNTYYRVGQNILIIDLHVPDLWISSVNSDYYDVDIDNVTPGTITTQLEEHGSVYIGWYSLSALETQKVNLEEINRAVENAYSEATGAQMASSAAQETANQAIEIAKGASRAIVLGGYDYVVDALLSYDENQLRQGDNIYLYDRDVPDLWISEVNGTYIDYSWNGQQEMIDIMTEQGYLSIGYYNISMLETQKANLEECIKNTDIGAGLTKNSQGKLTIYTHNSYGLNLSGGGVLMTQRATDAEIEAGTDIFKPIVPATVNKAVKVGITKNTEQLSDTEKTAACEWLGVNDLIGDLETALDAILEIQNSLMGGS